MTTPSFNGVVAAAHGGAYHLPNAGIFKLTSVSPLFSAAGPPVVQLGVTVLPAVASWLFVSISPVVQLGVSQLPTQPFLWTELDV